MAPVSSVVRALDLSVILGSVPCRWRPSYASAYVHVRKVSSGESERGV